MKNSIREYNQLKHLLDTLKKLHAEYDGELYEQRQNTKLKRGYLTINIRKVAIGNGHIEIDQLAREINELEMKIKSFKIRKLLEYKKCKF